MTNKWSNLIKFLFENDCVGVIFNFFSKKIVQKAYVMSLSYFFGVKSLNTSRRNSMTIEINCN
jgi:hypothetical protein